MAKFLAAHCAVSGYVGNAAAGGRRVGSARLLRRPLREQVDAAADLAVHGVEDRICNDGRHLRRGSALGL